VPIDTHYYAEEDGDEVVIRRMLNWYRDYFKDTPEGASILVPIGAMRALRRLGRFSKGKALVISGDKGNNNPEQFTGLMDPHIAVHGSFSLMVNYHAIGAFFTLKGGFALHNMQEEASLKCSSFVLDENTYASGDSSREGDSAWLGDALNDADEQRASQYPHLSQAFKDGVEQFGPNDFFVLQKCLKEECANPALRSVVALLKLSDWDPDVFFKFRDVILNQAPTCGKKLHNDLTRGIPRVWTNYYLMDLDKDIAFEIGRFYYGIRDYKNALWYYMESTRTVGEHHVTYHNQGLCHYSRANYETALENFRKALAMNNDYEKARSWVEKVEKELAEKEKKKEEERVDSVTGLLLPSSSSIHAVEGGGGGDDMSPPPAPPVQVE
jgi:tetratricopeptide (TPR) repeat protein